MNEGTKSLSMRPLLLEETQNKLSLKLGKLECRHSLIEKNNTVIIDGSNVAFANPVRVTRTSGSKQVTHSKLGLFGNIILVEQKLLEINPDLEIIIICDANIPYKIFDFEVFRKYKKQNLFLVPAKTNADFFILSYGLMFPDCLIVSNDQFKEFNGEFGRVKQKRVPFMIIKDEVIFYDSKIE